MTIFPIIARRTLSPLDMYPRMLNFMPVVTERLGMSLNRLVPVFLMLAFFVRLSQFSSLCWIVAWPHARACVCPLIVTRGSDQEAITTKFEGRRDPSVLRNYGALLLQFTLIVPDGMGEMENDSFPDINPLILHSPVCFFPSYRYMEETVSVWDEIGILRQVVQHKLLFVETPDSVESSLALSNYRYICTTLGGP